MNPKRHIIPVFVPHLGCPNDCVFCNQRAITGVRNATTGETVLKAIDDARRIIPDAAAPELAFYGGSFTAIDDALQLELLEAAQRLFSLYSNASIRVSTRPDCVDDRAVDRLAKFGVRCVELGAQSMCDDVLNASNRGHTSRDTVAAADLLRERGVGLILQMMTGLPGDTAEKSVLTAQRIIALKPDGVRIYPTVIIRGSALYDMWTDGRYSEHTVEDAVELCATLADMFEQAGIPVIRMGLNPSDELSGGEAAGGAYHPAFGELVMSRRYLEKALHLLKDAEKGGAVELLVHKTRISAMTGHKGGNIRLLQERLGLESVKVRAGIVEKGEIVIKYIEKESSK